MEGGRATDVPRRYVVAHDVFYAEKAPDADISIVKIAREVVGGIKRGADVTNVNLPASVLDPVSSLEKSMKSMQRGELLGLVSRAETPRARFLAVLRFYFSGLSKEKFGKKPYNPILGEVFRAGFAHRSGDGHSVLVAEQVSHHPPVTAMHLRNDTLRFRMNSYAAPEPRFWGNSVEVKLRGCIRIALDAHGEEYVATRPQMLMSGFFAGRHRLEFVGASSVACAASGLRADVDFASRGILGRGELNAVSGRVVDTRSGALLYSFAGTWDGVITMTDPAGGTFVLFDYQRIVDNFSMVALLPPEAEREESFSSRVWADCSKAIWAADTPAANAAKRDVEDAARARAKRRVAAKRDWEPRYFQPRSDGDGYQLRDALQGALGPDVHVSNDQKKIMALTQKFDVNDVDMAMWMAAPGASGGVQGNGDSGGAKKKLLGRSRK